MRIDYGRLERALRYYELCGFEYVELPYTASQQAIQMTFDGNYSSQILPNGAVLVGSGEQAFCDLLLQGKLKLNEKYMGLTPCFREEEIYNDIHRPYFLKLELYSPVPSIKAGHEYMNFFSSISKRFFQSEIESNLSISKTHTPNSIDLNLNQIEIGSYLVNTSNKFCWACGTGLAEPRFSAAISL